MQLSSKAQLRIIISLVGLLGLALIAIASFVSWKWEIEWAANALREIGGAFLIAALLGFTVHEWLSLQIARDVFEGAMGYVLQDNLREEVKWIARMDRLAKRFDLIITLEEVEDDASVFKVTSQIAKEIHNICDQEIDVTAMLDLDEWGYQDKSAIEECEIRSSGGAIENSFGIERGPSHIKGETKPYKLKPGNSVETISKGHEFKPRNSDFHVATLYPIHMARVHVTAPKGTNWIAYASSRTQARAHYYLPEIELPGTVLPGQRIVVRWWPATNVAEQDVVASG